MAPRFLTILTGRNLPKAKAKGTTVFARIDHAAGAAAVGSLSMLSVC